MTVLVIEDDASFRRTLTAFLEDSGYQVAEAANGQEGLDCFERQKPDIVVTDLRMPVMDGFEFMARLNSTGCGTPVIVLTGTGDPQTPAAALDRGARQCILKPVADLCALERAIERALASPR
jgi:CheY-like chemotaxis protein